ncbi:MAG: PilN domain-containing protein [Thermodesulfovibrionales bacterium]|nr:PilN domain-containing protein [Thermodesulfovibrionales bacterium]
MIRINLLPAVRKRKKRPKPLPSFIVIGVLLSLFASIGIVYAMFHLKNKISSLEAEKKNNEKEIAELNKKLKDVENFEKLNKSFKERKEIIEKLRKDQSFPVKILNEVSKALPPGVWLTNLSYGGDSITLEGYGYTNDDVVSYVDGLKKSDLFTDVYLHETKLTTIEKISVYQFKISFKVKA